MDQIKHAPPTSASASAPSDTITYKLSYNPSQIQLSQTTRLSALEHRLHRLEGAVGGASDQLARLSGGEGVSLLETAQRLSAKSALLDSAQLDHIEGRLTALGQKMDAVREREDEGDAEKDQMVSDKEMRVVSFTELIAILPT